MYVCIDVFVFACMTPQIIIFDTLELFKNIAYVGPSEWKCYAFCDIWEKNVSFTRTYIRVRVKLTLVSYLFYFYEPFPYNVNGNSKLQASTSCNTETFCIQAPSKQRRSLKVKVEIVNREDLLK